jgi:hypothetical protein
MSPDAERSDCRHFAVTMVTFQGLQAAPGFDRSISLPVGFTLCLGLFGCAATLPPGGGVDFQTRCHGPGVIRCFGFDSASEVDPHVYPPTGQKDKRGRVVTDVKASGAGSLRFEIPPHSGSDTSGSFWLNFKDDLSAQFGEGGEFYIQWRQRFSREFLDTPYPGGGGWKQIIVGEGDRPGATAYSCTQLELVVNNPYHLGYPSMYHSCGGKDGQFEGLFSAGSVRYYPDEWMTFQLHVKIGTWYKNDGAYHGDSTVQLWVAREHESSKLVVDLSPQPARLFGLKIPGTGTGYDLANNNPAAKYGKLWLLPYNTGKDPFADHPTAYTWYDELIIATNRIPDPQ